MIDWKAFRQQMQSDPKKVLSFVIGLATVFFVMWAYVLITSNLKKEVPETVNVNKAELPEAVVSASDSSRSEAEVQLPAFQRRTKESGNSLPNVMPVLFLFLVVVTGFWLMKKGRKRMKGASEFMDVLGTQQLALNQQVSLVRINSEYWVLGHSNGNISLLQRYNEEEWQGKPSQSDREKGQSSLDASFLSLLKRENQQYETFTETT